MSEHSYTTIVYADKKRTGLTFGQFTFCDAIYHLSNNELGWCYAKNKSLAETFDVSTRSIIRWTKELIDSGFIEKCPDTGYLKTTKKWYEIVICKKEYQDKKTCDENNNSDKMSHPLYKDDTNRVNLKDKDVIITKDVIISEKTANENDKSSNQPLAEKEKTPRWDSGAWYANEFDPLYHAFTEQRPLRRGKEWGQAKTFFESLAEINPNAPPEEIYKIATMGAEIVFETQANGGLFAWLDMPPPIGWFSSNADRVDLAVKTLNGITQEQLDEQEETTNAIAELEAISKAINEQDSPNQITSPRRNALSAGSKIPDRRSRH